MLSRQNQDKSLTCSSVNSSWSIFLLVVSGRANISLVLRGSPNIHCGNYQNPPPNGHGVAEVAKLSVNCKQHHGVVEYYCSKTIKPFAADDEVN